MNKKQVYAYPASVFRTVRINRIQNINLSIITLPGYLSRTLGFLPACFISAKFKIPEAFLLVCRY